MFFLISQEISDKHAVQFFIWRDSGKLTVQCSLQTDLNNKKNWIARQNYPYCIS